METKLGRPPLFDEKMLKVAHTLPQDLVDELDTWASKTDTSRSEVLRRLCRFLLDSPRLMESALRNGQHE